MKLAWLCYPYGSWDLDDGPKIVFEDPFLKTETQHKWGRIVPIVYAEIEE